MEWECRRAALPLSAAIALTLSLPSQKVHSPDQKKYNYLHLSKLWKAKFFILCDVIFLVGCRGHLGVEGLIHMEVWTLFRTLSGPPVNCLSSSKTMARSFRVCWLWLNLSIPKRSEQYSQTEPNKRQHAKVMANGFVVRSTPGFTRNEYVRGSVRCTNYLFICLSQT